MAAQLAVEELGVELDAERSFLFRSLSFVREVLVGQSQETIFASGWKALTSFLMYRHQLLYVDTSRSWCVDFHIEFSSDQRKPLRDR